MYCNPMNLPYKFQYFKMKHKKDMKQKKPHKLSSLHREAADPSIIFHNDTYWLFASMSEGFWYSKDLITWDYQETPNLPNTDYAPDIRLIDDYFYYCASKKDNDCSIYRTKDPLKGEWEIISTPFPFWDPHLYQDDDGRVYFYWGCSNKTPIYGVEMNRETMMPLGEPVELYNHNTTTHGWERIGENNHGLTSFSDKLMRLIIGKDPYIEGAWMTKHKGKYYLQYAAPGTNWNIYGDGVYEADHPLGPYTYAAHNPFSFKPGGFITGAGHGSTFEDAYGNLWHTSSMCVCINHMFERRLGLFPAGIDEDGILYCNTNFADYPTPVPTKEWNPITDAKPQWMLLSYKKPVTVSSSLEKHLSEYAVNENIKNYWSAKGNKDEWIQIDLEKELPVHAVQLNFSEHNCRADLSKNYTFTGEQEYMARALVTPEQTYQYVVEGSVDGSTWTTIKDYSQNTVDHPHEFITFEEEIHVRYLKITCKQMPFNGNFAMSGFRVFGTGLGNAPKQASNIIAKRTSDLDCTITWNKQSDATGYNIRWGIAPDKLYNSWLIYDDSKLDLGALNKGTDYYIAVDAFNVNGITEGTPIPLS